MDAAVAGLVGAVIGGLASGLGTYLQQRAQNKRDRQQMAANLGLAEYGHDLDLARESGKTTFVPPLAVYVLNNRDLLDAMAKGDVTPEMISAMRARRMVLLQWFNGVAVQPK